MPSTYAAAIKAREDFLRGSLARLDARTAKLSASLVEAKLALEAAQRVVDAFQNERASVDSQRGVLQNTLSALPPAFDPQIMQRLPPEMLRAIFHEVVFRPDPQSRTPTRVDSERSAAPFICASVCSRWRAIAISMASLWSYIAVPNILPDRQAEGQFYSERVLLLLERSKSHPLAVVLDWEDSPRWSLEPKFPRILAALAAHIFRWRRFEFMMPKGVTEKQVDYLRNPAPLLEFISVDSADDRMLPFNNRDMSPSYLPDSPLLRDFSSGTFFFTPRTPMMHLSVAYITFQDHPAGAVWAALQMMPALEELWYYCLDTPSDTVPEPPSLPLTLPSLRFFSVQGETRVASSWATTLRLPALEEVILRGHCLCSPGFREFCLAVCSGASALTLEGVHMDEEHLASPLPLPTIFPRLRRLTVAHGVQTSLLVHLRDCTSFPLLDSLELSGFHLRGEPAEALVQFAHNRNRQREQDVQPLRITIEHSSVASWLHAQLALILGDAAVCIITHRNDTAAEITELATTLSDGDDDNADEEDDD